jgi:hypothetical protein
VSKQTITVASPVLTSIEGVSLTPDQRSAVWELAGLLDEQRIPADQDDAIWIEAPTARLRGSGGRSDNYWLREILDRLTSVKIGGTWRGDRWGGVLLAEWRIEQGGSVVRLLLPPSGVRALRAPETFAKIDREAAHRLPPHARTLYGLLADKQRQSNKVWEVDLDEIKSHLGCIDKYVGRFNDFRRWVLDPAVEAIREFGVIDVTWEPVRLGRQVRAIRFTWTLKDPHTATATASENDRHSDARGKVQAAADAPPLVVVDQARRWLERQPAGPRIAWAKRARELGAENPISAPEQVSRWVPWVASEIVEEISKEQR